MGEREEKTLTAGAKSSLDSISTASPLYRPNAYGRPMSKVDLRMKRILRTGLLITTLASASIIHAQQPADPSLKPLTFLTGRWLSESPTEIQEENWSPVIGSSMTGSFRIIANGKPVFYEFWVVEIDANHPVLKLKHFNGGLTGWEEKDASTKMPLTSSATDDAVFTEPDGSVSLHYHRAGETLTCVVHHVRNGKSSDETFTLKRLPGN